MVPSFVSVGELMLDVELVRGADSHGGRISVRTGGTAANAAVWASAAGAASACIGRVGADAGALALRAALADHGVETLLAVDRDAPTGTVAWVDEELVVDRGASARLTAGDVPSGRVADALLVSGYTLLQDDTAPAGVAALRIEAAWCAVDAGATGLLRRLGASAGLRRLAEANALFVNEEEAAFLVEGSPTTAAAVLGERFRLVCVKLGRAGVVAVLDGELARAAPPKLHPGTARGAGDAFAAGVLVALAAGGDLHAALAVGCELGAAAAAAANGWPSPRR